MNTLPNELIENIFDHVCDLDNLSKTSVEFRNIARSLRKHQFIIHAKKFAPVLADIKSIVYYILGNESTLFNGNNLTNYDFSYGPPDGRRYSNSVFKFYINTNKKIKLDNFSYYGIINRMKMNSNGWVNEPHNVHKRNQFESINAHTITYIEEYNGVYSMTIVESPPVGINISSLDN